MVKVWRGRIEMHENHYNYAKCKVKDASKYYSMLYKSIVVMVSECTTIEWEWLTTLLKLYTHLLIFWIGIN